MAITGRYTSGYLDSTITSTVPHSPSNSGLREIQLKPATKAGMANGRQSSTFHCRRPRRSLRSTHQASARPSSAQPAVTATISFRVLPSRWNTKGRHSSCQAVCQPDSQLRTAT